MLEQSEGAAGKRHEREHGADEIRRIHHLREAMEGREGAHAEQATVHEIRRMHHLKAGIASTARRK